MLKSQKSSTGAVCSAQAAWEESTRETSELLSVPNESWLQLTRTKLITGQKVGPLNNTKRKKRNLLKSSCVPSLRSSMNFCPFLTNFHLSQFRHLSLFCTFKCSPNSSFVWILLWTVPIPQTVALLCWAPGCEKKYHSGILGLANKTITHFICH